MWVVQHRGNVPSTRDEKNEFKNLISSYRISFDHENFDEALSQAHRAWAPNSISSSVKRLFDDGKCLNLNSKSKPFWVMMRALRGFVDAEGEGMVPLPGTVPDMKADTEGYIKLQSMYVLQ